MTKTEMAVSNRLQRDGYKIFRNGWPDFLAVRGREIKFIEVKSPGCCNLSRAQKEMHGALSRAGISVETIIYKKRCPTIINGNRKKCGPKRKWIMAEHWIDGELHRFKNRA